MSRQAETGSRSRSSTSQRLRWNGSSARSRKASSETCCSSTSSTGTVSGDPRPHVSPSTTCATGRFGSRAASMVALTRTRSTRVADDYLRSTCASAAESPRISFRAARGMRRCPAARSTADSTSTRLLRACRRTDRIPIRYVTRWGCISPMPAGTSVTFRTGWVIETSPRPSSTFASRISGVKNAIARRSARQRSHARMVNTSAIRLTFFREFVNPQSHSNHHDGSEP
jgi:hypothetical protein